MTNTYQQISLWKGVYHSIVTHVLPLYFPEAERYLHSSRAEWGTQLLLLAPCPAATPVREIRAFDPDLFHVHNTFRSPARLDESELGKPKADVYGGRYDNYRHGLKIGRKFIDSSSGGDFEGVTFAFVCVDKGSARAEIFDLLISRSILFIDVGMGLDQKKRSRKRDAAGHVLFCRTWARGAR